MAAACGLSADGLSGRCHEDRTQLGKQHSEIHGTIEKTELAAYINA